MKLQKDHAYNTELVSWAFTKSTVLPASGNVVVWGVSFVIIFAFIVYGVLTPFLLLVGSLAGSSLWVIYKVATKLGEKYIA